jgi:tetratricopeptide (TPR) repeat protein
MKTLQKLTSTKPILMKQHLILFFNFLIAFLIFSCKEDPNRHLNLGNWYLQKGLLDEAIIEYREVSRLYSGDESRLSRDEYEALGKAHFKLAIAYTKKGWWDFALSEAKRSFEILPNKESYELVDLIEAKIEQGIEL